MSLTLVSGVFFPHAAAATSFTYMVAREMYARGYTARGPSARMTGNILSGVCMLGMLGMAVYGCVNHMIMKDPAFLSALAKLGIRA